MTQKNKREKLLIIGGGPAGLSAAIYAARAGLAPLVINGPEPGGQITTTSELENYPGFPGGIGGFDFMQRVTEQAKKFGTRLVFEAVEKVSFGIKPYTVETGMSDYKADSVIIATGASPRKLGLDKEEELVGSGVSYCATCDGALFKDKAVAVVGGGDVALEEAIFLTKFASRVYLIHRRDQLRGTKVLSDRAKANRDIEILWDTEVKKIRGEKRLEGLLVANNKTGDERNLSDAEGLFLAVGYNPNTEIFTGEIKLDQEGYIVTDEKQATDKPGIFAAGDVQDSRYRQVITSGASGAKAAMEADKYLPELEE